MKNVTPELIEKAKTAKNAEELFALAKENNVEMTEQEAETYFAQLNASGAVADEELDAVAGGALFDCLTPKIKENDLLRYKDGSTCRNCNCAILKAVKHSSGLQAVCSKCNTLVRPNIFIERVEVLT